MWRPPVVSRADRRGRRGRPVRRRRCPTLNVMAKRDPRDVLGVPDGASPAQIKAAWRRLARTNHPDLTGDDPAASRAATTRMAEINEAYATLTRKVGRDGSHTRSGAG